MGSVSGGDAAQAEEGSEVMDAREIAHRRRVKEYIRLVNTAVKLLGSAANIIRDHPEVPRYCGDDVNELGLEHAEEQLRDFRSKIFHGGDV